MLVLRKNFDALGIRISPEPDDVEEHVCCDLAVGGIYMEAGNSESFSMEKPYILKPGRCVVVQTAEKITVPDGFFGLLCSKGSLANRGLYVTNTKVDPVFSGELDVAIFNAGLRPFTVSSGMKFCAIIFLKLEELTQSTTARSSPRTATDRTGFIARQWAEHGALIITSIVTAIVSIGGAAFATYVTLKVVGR